MRTEKKKRGQGAGDTETSPSHRLQKQPTQSWDVEVEAKVINPLKLLRGRGGAPWGWNMSV